MGLFTQLLSHYFYILQRSLGTRPPDGPIAVSGGQKENKGCNNNQCRDHTDDALNDVFEHPLTLPSLLSLKNGLAILLLL